MEFTVQRDAHLDPEHVHELRLAVGWPSDPKRQADELEQCYAYFSVTVGGQIVGFLNVVSNGVTDALLNNLMVHPDYRRQGIGKALLRTAVDELSGDGLKYFNLVFEEDLVPFYRRCGFTIQRGGVIDLFAGGKPS